MKSKKGSAKNKKKKRTLKEAKGYRGRRSTSYRTAKQSVRRAKRSSWEDRKQKKRDFRQLWITRINAAARQRGMNYSRLIGGLKRAEVKLNRKMLADLAVNDKQAFDKVVDLAQQGLE